jgi:3-deoxy-D-manno-octulosonate 8-phosphate phosphatase (KDO 8-P phosphatase)
MSEFKNNAANIKAVLLDVDGVMTDGKLYYTKNGEEIKTFNVRDGLGIKLLLKEKITLGIISGRNSDPLLKRLNELGIIHRFLGSTDKSRDFQNFLKDSKLTKYEVAYIGDDLPDLAILRSCGLSACPADAPPEVISLVDYVSPKKGGDGVVRDVAEYILKSSGRWPSAIRSY